ncbi:MAG: peptidoglycan DD-metalloendopeptidase family protein [Caulobacterales bacterium]
MAGGPALAASKPTAKEIAKAEADKVAAQKQSQNLAKEAAAAEREAKALADKLVAAAAEERRFEAAATDAEVRLQILSEAADAAKTRLYTDRRALQNVLAALMLYARQRPPAIAAHESRAQDAVRAAILLGAIEPELEARARKLAKQIDDLTKLRQDEAEQAKSLAIAEGELSAKKQEILALIAEKRARQAKLSIESKRFAQEAAKAGAKAQSLRELVAAIASKAARGAASVILPKPSPGGLRFSSYRGKLSPPAAGVFTTHFGQVLAAGDKSQGLAIKTRRRAQVSAPFDGRIEFAGPWRSYGGLVILNVGEGYVIVLAGMSEVFGVAGQEVLAGEPLGEMTDRRDPSPELYFELRRNGVPTNPGPWMKRGV